MLVVKGAQRWSVAHPDPATAATGTVVVATIAMLEEKADDGQRRDGVPQAEGIDVVAQDALGSVRRLTEWVVAVLPPEAVPIQIRDKQEIDESEERRLLEEEAALLDRYCEAQGAVGIEMVVVGADSTTNLARLRESVWERVRHPEFDLERLGDGLQTVRGRLEPQRAGKDGVNIVLDDAPQSLVDTGQLGELLPQILSHPRRHGLAGRVM